MAEKIFKEYRNKIGQWHREDGPAVIYIDGEQRWYINGRLHRVGLPAIIYPNGGKKWYLNGFYHREDGPAIMVPGEEYEYWVNKKQYTKEEFEKMFLKKV